MGIWKTALQPGHVGSQFIIDIKELVILAKAIEMFLDPVDASSVVVKHKLQVRPGGKIIQKQSRVSLL